MPAGTSGWPEATGGASERLVIGCVGESWYSVLKVTASGPGQRSAGGLPGQVALVTLPVRYSFFPTAGAHRAA